MKATTRSNMKAIDAALQAASMSTSINLTSEQLDAAADAFYKIHQALEASAALIEAHPSSDNPKHDAAIKAAVEALRKIDYDLCYDCGEFKAGTIERSQYTEDNILCEDCNEARAADQIEWEREQSKDYYS